MSKKQEAAARLGSIGGSVKSARKTAANRINGKKGGRPKIHPELDDLAAQARTVAPADSKGARALRLQVKAVRVGVDAEMQPYLAVELHAGLDLGAMSAELWAPFLAGTKANYA